MSIANTQTNIEYPESDGKPMGETDLHRDWMVRILELLRYRYRDQRVYIASDLLVYYEEGEPTRFVVPDDFIVLDCEPGRRRVFKIWEEGKSPEVVFEVTSRSTSRNDLVDKPVVYERMGVKEYYLYDPSGDEMSPPLQGYRMQNGVLKEIKMQDGKLHCATLGVDLQLDDDDLVMTDSVTGSIQLTAAEAYFAALEAERHALDAERHALDAERNAKDIEKSARLAAESELRRLTEELNRLRGEQSS